MSQRASDPDDVAKWARVDNYLEGQFLSPDASLEAALSESRSAGLPAIQVSPTQGKWLHLVARAIGARRILEVGTLGGYSAIWLARALGRGGRLVTLEVNPLHAEVARRNIARAGLASRVDVRLGDAKASLAAMVAAGEGPFDLIFIDADKPGYPDYFESAVRLARVGALLVVDNVVRRGDVVDAASEDPSVRGVRAMNERFARDPRVSGTVLQTVGAKGHDGFGMFLRVEDGSPGSSTAPSVSRPPGRSARPGTGAH